MADIALYGGGFNPIGKHHEKIAIAVHEITKFPVWIMPCYSHTLEKDSNLIDSFHRWNMVELAVENLNFAKAFDWEMTRRSSGRMHETIQQLKKHFPKNVFHIVIGEDNAELIKTKWFKGEELIKENPFIVVSRSNSKKHDNWFNFHPHRMIETEIDGSSTSIREACSNQDLETLKQLVARPVYEYIVCGKLFGL